jgi:hypothetical protein
MLDCLWMPSVLLSFTATSFAVIDATSTTNTSDPGDGVPWANVGSVNGGSGEYLGNGWVLTAAHVGAGPIALDSGTFQPDGRVIRLTNPNDSSATDILLYHVVVAPNLSGLTISATNPGQNAAVTMVGYGRISTSITLNTYSTAYPAPNDTKSGFDWSGSGVKSYGTNEISRLFNEFGALLPVVYTQNNLGYGTLQVFGLTFSGAGQTSDEGQVATGDSGGAVFYKRVNAWELAGMIDARGSWVDPQQASVYGDESYIGDLATYKTQIDALVSSTAGGAIWTGANGSTWAGANWSSSPVPGAANNVHTATFNSAGGVNDTINLGGGVTLNTVLFDTASAAAYTIGSGTVGSQTLTLENGGAITTSSTVTNGQVVNAAVVLGTDRSAQTYTISNNATTPATALTLAGNITGAASGGVAGAKTLAVVGAGDTDITGGIAKGGATSIAVTKAGTGTLNLAAGSALAIDSLMANDGTTTVNSTLGTGTSVTVNDTGGGAATSLKFGSVSQTLASLTIGAGATVTFTSGPASFTGSTSGKAAGFGSGQPSGGLVPEPGTTGLLLAGALGLLARRARRTR